MTRMVRRDRWPTLRLSGLLTGTGLVLGATIWWALGLHGDGSYLALVTGAWTMTVMVWTLFLVRVVRRRRDA